VAALSGFGVAIELPDGWDCHIYSRSIYGNDAAGGTRAAIHAGSFPLPDNRGDFGSGAVEAMADDDVFLVLLEYDPACTQQPLFAADGPPAALDPGAFSSTVLQRALPGQAGSQAFFSTSGRAFCLYVVLGQLALRDQLVERANRVIETIRVSRENSSG
jgi:hypothetical protein